MRRIFIIRKDLHLSAGKLTAMVAHCAEAYWTRLIRNIKPISVSSYEDHATCTYQIELDRDIVDNYINDRFVKTICQAKNKNALNKAVKIATEDLHLVEGKDFGFINDCCLTELEPENEDGTTTIGLWFKPLEDEKAHLISKKYHLYTD